MNYSDQMPKFMGQPYYPYGRPFPPTDVAVGGFSIAEIYTRYIEGEAAEAKKKAEANDEAKLKAYIDYCINAPCNLPKKNEELDELMKSESLVGTIVEKCIELGIETL